MPIPSKVRSVGIFLAIISVGGTLSSCQKKMSDVLVEKVIEQSTGKKVDVKSGGQDITIE